MFVHNLTPAAAPLSGSPPRPIDSRSCTTRNDSAAAALLAIGNEMHALATELVRRGRMPAGFTVDDALALGYARLLELNAKAPRGGPGGRRQTVAEVFAAHREKAALDDEFAGYSINSHLEAK